MKTEPSSASTSEHLCKLALGTVQFGQDYGISNDAGQPKEREVRDILNLAASHGLDLLDTAPVYGEAELVLGRILNNDDTFRIITKTPALCRQKATGDFSSKIHKTFEQSLLRMKCDQVYGLIIHLVEDLLGPNGDRIWATLESIKTAGLVQKIGVSCYKADDLAIVHNRYPIDLAQIPFSIFDQNLYRNNLIETLNKSGVEIHTRSALLQGLALMLPDNLPDGFTRAEPHIRAFHGAAKTAHCTPLELALGFVNSRKEIDRMVIGVTSSEELQEIFDALLRDFPLHVDTETLAVEDEAVITPSQWPPDSQKSWSFDFSTQSNEN